MDGDEATLIALRLSKSGYGRPDEILAMSTDLVMYALEYEGFIKDYESAFSEINKNEDR